MNGYTALHNCHNDEDNEGMGETAEDLRLARLATGRAAIVHVRRCRTSCRTGPREATSGCPLQDRLIIC